MAINVYTCVIILYGLLGDPTTSVKCFYTQKTGRKTLFRYVPLFNEWNLKWIKRPKAAHAMSLIFGSTGSTKVTSLFLAYHFKAPQTVSQKHATDFIYPLVSQSPTTNKVPG